MEPFRAVGSDYRPPPGTESGEGFVALVGAEIAYGLRELGVQPVLGKQQMSRARGIPAGDRLLDAALGLRDVVLGVRPGVESCAVQKTVQPPLGDVALPPLHKAPSC
mgnify:CR=1 FL=1